MTRGHSAGIREIQDIQGAHLSNMQTGSVLGCFLGLDEQLELTG